MANEFMLPDGTTWMADLSEFKRPPADSKFFEGHHTCHPVGGDGEPKLLPASIVDALIKRHRANAANDKPSAT